MELLEAANVVRGDGNWTSGGQYEAPGCALRSYTSPVCAPAREPLSNTAATADDDLGCGVDRFPFAVLTSMRARARSDGDFQAWVRDAMDAEVEKAAGKFLAEGDPAIPVDHRVATLADVPPTNGSSEVAAVYEALAEFRRRATGVKDSDTLMHLGLQTLWAVDALIVDEGDRLEGTKVRVVTSPGYPPDFIGVTGPVTVRISDTYVDDEYAVAVNDREIEATSFVSIEFDPCTATVGAVSDGL